MKKNKLYTFAAAILLASGLVSCGDSFLTEEPASSVPIKGYYTDNAKMIEAMAAAYDPMQWFDYYNGWFPLNLAWDAASDDIYPGGSDTSDQGYLHEISWYGCSPTNDIKGAWTVAYSGINRSIRLMDNAEEANISEADKKSYNAEGRVLRDWYYLVLWKTWGNVPFYTENLTFPYIAEQLKADEVYNNMVTDLEEVLDSKILPMKRELTWAGRMTQAAAAMIYADYVMYQKDERRYSKALGYVKEVIASGQYKLVTDYDDLFTYATEWSDEIILDINYISAGGKRGWGDAGACGGTVIPAMIGVDGLTYVGGQETGHGPYTEFEGGWGFCVITQDAYEAFEPGDIRRDVAVLNLDTYQEEMMNRGIAVNYTGRYQNTGYFLRKYLGRPGGKADQAGDADLNWENNFHLYRYAETLLVAAELAWRTNSGEAQGYFDQIRERAGLSPKAISEEAIMQERRVELLGEGKRYFDLIRFGKAAEVLKPGGGAIYVTKDAHRFVCTDGTVTQDKPKGEVKTNADGKPLNLVINGELKWTGKGAAIPQRPQWTENKKYLPIPQIEIESSHGATVQNPY